MIKAQNTISTNLILVGISLFGIYPLIPHKFESISVFFICAVFFDLSNHNPKKNYIQKNIFFS